MSKFEQIKTCNLGIKLMNFLCLDFQNTEAFWDQPKNELN